MATKKKAAKVAAPSKTISINSPEPLPPVDRWDQVLHAIEAVCTVVLKLEAAMESVGVIYRKVEELTNAHNSLANQVHGMTPNVKQPVAQAPIASGKLNGTTGDKSPVQLTSRTSVVESNALDF